MDITPSLVLLRRLGIRAAMIAAAGFSMLGAGCSASEPLPDITVNSITAESTVGSVSPPSGDYFAQVSVTMTNPSTNAYSMWFYYFQLVTSPSDLGLNPPGDANSVVSTACSVDITLGPEIEGPSHYTCNLVFAVPCGETPAGLIYTPADVATNTPSFTPPACSN